MRHLSKTTTTRNSNSSRYLSILPGLAALALFLPGCVIEDNTGDTGGTGSGMTNGTVGTGMGMGTGSGVGTGTGMGTGSGGGGGGAAAMCDRAATPTMMAPNSISANATWSGVVAVNQTVAVSGTAVLTIQPGTTILMGPDTSLEIGRYGDASQIQAVGTAAAPIVFCGKTQSKGSWKGITIKDKVASNSSIAYTTIEDGGTADQAALTVNAPIKLSHININNAAGYGLEASAFATGSDGLTIKGSAKPAHLTAPLAVQNFPSNALLTGNTEDVVETKINSITKTETKFRDLGVPYRQLDDLYLSDSGAIRFDAGVKYEFAVDKGLEIGRYGDVASIFVDGTADKPVEFSAQSKAAGGWTGITIQGAVLSTSSIKHAKLHHGGGADMSAPSLKVGAPITLDNVTIDQCNSALTVAQVGLSATSTKVNVSNCKGHPITAHPEALYNLPVDGAFSTNEKQSILVVEGALNKTGTIKAAPIPYHIKGSTYTSKGAVVTIAAGTNFQMGADSSLEFGRYGDEGAVIAKGSMAAPIKFVGANATAGYWKNISVLAGQNSQSAFDFVEISHGGGGMTSLLDLARAVPVTNSKLSDSAGWGIRRRSDDMTDYKATNTFTNVASGDVGDL